MKEKITDTLVDLLLSGVKEKIDGVRDDYKWRKLFVDTRDFCPWRWWRRAARWAAPVPPPRSR